MTLSVGILLLIGVVIFGFIAIQTGDWRYLLPALLCFLLMKDT